ncbi:NAD(P)-binding protein [Meredithblackwellia eburnea MCA 4105]
MASKKPIAVIAGIGNGSGTGAATARLFATQGYHVATVARNSSDLQTFTDSITASGGSAKAFPINSYNHSDLAAAFSSISKQWPDASGVRFALWNAGSANWGKFLDITEEQIKQSVDVNIVGAFAFGQEVVKAILATTGEKEKEEGHRGTLIFTGATAALRGGNGFSAFAAGKFGIRAISQSIAREYGPEGIHVAHAIIDGSIVTNQGKARFASDADRLAKYEDPRKALKPESIAETYLFLHRQDASAWAQEIDLRPAHEKF